MAEMRLIDANALSGIAFQIAQYGKGIRCVVDLNEVDKIPTVDAVEANKYEALVGMYHDLRENFIDYVCSGTRNEAPYCLNKCEECVDKRGWCKLERCQGFNPAEYIVDGERSEGE